MLPKIAIWGASGHALVVADILRLRGEHEIVGLLDDVNPENRGQRVGGMEVLGGRDQLAVLRTNGVKLLIIAIGNCEARHKLALAAKEHGFEFATAIHPGAIVASDVKIGEGSVIVAGAVINPAARLGAHVIVNTCTSVDHECVIGNAVHIGPGAHLGGRVTVGNCAWIGIGATVLDRINVGTDSLIGAGSVVTKDIPANVVAYGVPAKVIRTAADQRSR
ncbi:MAG: acetyltransferase [Limisphaerales bacterium]